MKYSIKIQIELFECVLKGFVCIENYEVEGENLFFRLDNNFVRNHQLYTNKEKGIYIDKILDENMQEIKHEILRIECGRVFCKVKTSTEKIYVQYRIPMKIIDGCMRLEDSIYGGLSCYPRLVNTKKVRNICLDCEKNDYFLEIIVPGECNVITSGEIVDSYEEGKRLCYRGNNITGFGLIVSINTKYVEELLGDIKIQIYYFYDGKHFFDKECAMNVLEILKNGIAHMREIMGFFPYNQISICPGMPFFGGGYASANIIFINYADSMCMKKKELRAIIFHELAHMYFGYYLNDDSYYGKCISKGLSTWFQKYIDWKFYSGKAFNIKGEIEENGVHPICYYEKYITDGSNWNQLYYHDISYEMITRIYCNLGEKRFIKLIRNMVEKYKDKILYYDDFISEVGLDGLDRFFIKDSCEDSKTFYLQS